MPLANVNVSTYQEIKLGNTFAMYRAVATGPIKVSIEADADSFHLYSSGLFDDKECGHVHDHAVSVVGWGITDDSVEGETAGVRYWILRNSWGTSWGEEGYMRIKIANGYGICGINVAPVIAMV